ncbi:MAG TPA: helix-turn-helix transcriptional regulator, partial [Dehalococcoidia bacterium]
MGGRGRPKHPDVLTPREREVLDLVRVGRTNGEIAALLGISVAGVKYHVSEILGKLNVSDRTQAANWEPGARHGTARGMGGVPPMRWLPMNVVQAAASVVAVVAVGVGVGLLTWGVVV